MSAKDRRPPRSVPPPNVQQQLPSPPAQGVDPPAATRPPLCDARAEVQTANAPTSPPIRVSHIRRKISELAHRWEYFEDNEEAKELPKDHLYLYQRVYVKECIADEIGSSYLKLTNCLCDGDSRPIFSFETSWLRRTDSEKMEKEEKLLREVLELGEEDT